VKNHKTTEGWFYKGRRPSAENMRVLAKAFAERIPGATELGLIAEMNRHYVLAALCYKLSLLIGWDRVMDLIGTLYHQTTRLQRLFDDDEKQVEETYPQYLLQLIKGTASSSVYRSIRYLCETENDPEWKRDIVCAERDWASRLIQANPRFTGESVLVRNDGNSLFAPTPKSISADFDYTSASFLEHMIDGEVALWGGAGPEAYNWEEKTERHFRAAVKSNAGSARDHLSLGVYLGINARFPLQIDEGFRECCRAGEMRPEWDLPRIEAANILLRVGNHRDALVLLEKAAADLRRMTPRLAYTIGFAKMMDDDFPGAVSMFQKAIELKHDYALAFDNAAFCSFQLGDKVNGRKYAKSARQFGVHTTYDMYRVGKAKQEMNPVSFPTLCETVKCPERDCKGRAESKEIREQWRKTWKP